MKGDDCKTCWHYCAPGEGPRFAGDKDPSVNEEGCMLVFLSGGLRPIKPERTCKSHETRAEQRERIKREDEEARRRDALIPRCPTCGRKLRKY